MRKLLFVLLALGMFLVSAYAEIQFTRNNIEIHGLGTEVDPTTHALMTSHGYESVLAQASLSVTIVGLCVTIGYMIIAFIVRHPEVESLVRRLVYAYFLVGATLHIMCITQPIPAETILAIPEIIRGLLGGYFFL